MDETKGRGRPKGSVDTAPRKKRSDRVLNATPDEISAITEFNFLLSQLPPVNLDNEDEIRERVEEYWRLTIEHGMRPGVAGLCLALGISRSTWVSWGSGRTRSYRDLVERVRSLLESQNEQLMVSGKMNPIVGIFLSKANFGYKEDNQLLIRTEQNNSMSNARTIEEIAARYREQEKIAEMYGQPKSLTDSVWQPSALPERTPEYAQSAYNGTDSIEEGDSFESVD